MNNSDFQDRIKQFQNLIDQSNHIVFFWWAGVSTESGVPDFRSKDWLYNQHDVQFEKYQPEYLLSHSCLYNEPKVFFEYYRQKMDCRWVKPNITHKKLAELEKIWKLSAIIPTLQVYVLKVVSRLFWKDNNIRSKEIGFKRKRMISAHLKQGLQIPKRKVKNWCKNDKFVKYLRMQANNGSNLGESGINVRIDSERISK